MRIKFFFSAILILLCFDILKSQEIDSSSDNFIKKNFDFAGDLGIYGELYLIKGQMKRRPSSTGRIYLDLQ
jgi:hypothetical protein